jgi:hypothetical protein
MQIRRFTNFVYLEMSENLQISSVSPNFPYFQEQQYKNLAALISTPSYVAVREWPDYLVFCTASN